MNKSFVFGWVSGGSMMAAPALLIARESVWSAVFMAAFAIPTGVVHEVYP